MISVYSGDRFITERPWQGQEITIARFLQENGLQMDMPCGGHGRCGKCRVLVVGDVLPPEESELKMLSAEERGQGVRLACKAVICGNQVRISLARQKKIDVETHTALENMIWRPWGRGLGLSVDIGTTTVAAYLWDLDAHRQLGVRACKNPQERFGADVVSRLEAALNGNGNALRGDICQCINTLAGELCSGCGHTPEEIHSAVVTGNTTMLYLLCGYDVHDIAFVPFEAAHRFGEFMSSAELGLHMAQDCRVYLPPCISAYVGADISCGLLDCNALDETGPALLADVGTNGEIAVIDKGKIYCCATAAGPAFEGVGISCGSSAVPGAVDRVKTAGGELEIHTIGGLPPVSICGSGLMDAVYCLLRTGGIEETGFMENGQAALGGDVVLTQKDVRAFQLAKSAVCAGMETLLHHAGLSAQQVKRVWLCGGFGNKLSVESAAGVGLLPAAMAGGVVTCGNSAAAGAARLLCDEDTLKQVQEIVRRCETVELADSAVFQERFMEDMMLGEVM